MECITDVSIFRKIWLKVYSGDTCASLLIGRYPVSSLLPPQNPLKCSAMSRPLGFFSYATVNDVHANGRLSELREVLEAEVRDHGVSDFHLFQDKSDIRGGDDWKQLIQEKLYASTVLIPLVTPTFLSAPGADGR